MKRLYTVLLAATAFLFNSCLEQSDPSLDQENFNAIFDSNLFSVENYPIDVKQTADGGYIILGERRLPESNFRGVYLLKADRFGKFVAEVELGDSLVNPVGDFLPADGKFYFFCMDGLNQESQLVEIDESLGTVNILPAGGLTYPAATALDEGNILLLSYDHENKQMVLSIFNTDGTPEGEPVAFSIGVGDDVEEPIINHFIRTGKRLPFLVGRIPSGLYYFNGFYNYTFSLVFTDRSAVNGVVQGQQDDGGISSVQALGGSKFAASRFNFGDNYFLPNVVFETTSTSSAVNLEGNSFPELTANAPVKIKRVIVNDEHLVLFASDTKSKQVGMYFYDEETGAFRSSRYLGFSNPYEVASISQTDDGGLVIVGTTYLAGRFPRIFLSKISNAELASQAQ
jgi:hypothetical protein